MNANAERKARARERLQRFRAARWRLDPYLTKPAAEAIARASALAPKAALVSTTALVNWVLSEWAAGKPCQGAPVGS